MSNPASEDVPRMLEELWRSRLRHLWSAVVEGQTDHEEIANLAEHVGHDYKGRVLIELIQNAQDQAVAAGLSGGSSGLDESSFVVVVRTETCLAVLNQGEPFNEKGLKAITSLGIANKDAATQVGNKGIGFKSVYEITGSPMILSRTDGEGLHDLGTGGWLRVVLSLCPFEECALLTETLEDEVRQLQSGREDQWRGLVERFTEGEAAIRAILEAARRAAPFKFPVPVEAAHAAAVLASLCLPEDLLSKCCTAVVLPCEYQIDDPLKRALDELFDDQAQLETGAVILGTPGVSRLVLLDSASDRYQIQHRRLEVCRAGPRPGVRFFEASVSVSSFDDRKQAIEAVLGDGSLPSKRALWLGARKTIGGSDSGADQRAEKTAIRKAVQRARLPHAGWEKVDSAPVMVAIPIGPELTVTPGPLDCRGRITIGLPTFVATGTPWWIDSRFHGDIARKHVEQSDPYNSLLLDEAVRLISEVVTDLQGSEEIGRRRLATLAMEAISWRTSGNSSIPNRLWRDGAFGRGAVVLGANGQSYLPVESMRLPDARDLDHDGLRVFDALTEGASSDDLNRLGLVFPDRHLHQIARKVLVGMMEQIHGEGTEAKRVVGPEPYIRTGPTCASLVESLASRRRDAGPEFWKRFLGWMSGRYQIQQIQEQRFLPVEGGGLARPSDRVFIAPRRTRDDQEEVSLDDLPDDLRQSLGFFDDAAVPTRQPDGRTMTEFARSLVSSVYGGPTMLESPRKQQVLKRLIAPRLAGAIERGNDLQALSLLQIVVGWCALGKGLVEAETRKIEEIRVPVAFTDDDGIIWRSPDKVYFGSGWLDDPRAETALQEAYGRHGRTLVPWAQLRNALGLDDSQVDDWRKAMIFLGVDRWPRVVRPDVPGEPPYYDGYNNVLTLRDEARCPFAECLNLGEYWSAWVKKYLRRRAPTRSGTSYQYRFKSTEWIDGIEDEDSRASVLELMFMKPERYEESARTTIVRDGGGWSDEPGSVLSLWAYAIRFQRWRVVPTSKGIQPCLDAWLLSEEDQKRIWAELLMVAHPVPLHAWGLLGVLGASEPRKATAPRLIRELHTLAAKLGVIDPSASATRALAGMLFELVAERFRTNPQESLGTIVSRPVPLMRGARGRIEAQDLNALSENVYVADDAARATFVPNWGEALRLPGSPRDIGVRFTRELANLTTGGRVCLTSECPVETGFVKTAGLGPLLAWLEQEWGATCPDQVAAVAAFLGGTEADLLSEKSRFRMTWDRIKTCRIAVGTFGLGVDFPAFYNHDANELQVASSIRNDRLRILAALWMLVGVASRDAYGAYASALREGPTAASRFFEERAVTEADFEKLYAATGRGRRSPLETYKEAILGLWRCLDRNASAISLVDLISAEDKKIADVIALTGITDLASRLHEVRDLDAAEAAFLWVSPHIGGVTAWQQARLDLGLHGFEFADTREKVAQLRLNAACHLMSECARLEDRSVVSLFAQAMSEWTDEPVKADILQRDPRLVEGAEVVASELNQKLAGMVCPELVSRLSRAQEKMPGEPWSVLGAQREVALYKQDERGSRESQAESSVRSALQVATALAPFYGETLAVAKVRADSALKVFLEGHWANRYAAVLALRAPIAEQAPKVAERLSQQRAFRDQEDQWRVLWKRFDELGAPPEPQTPPPPPPRRVTVLGTEVAEGQLDAELLKGSTGTIGAKVKERVDPDLDLSNFRKQRKQLEKTEPGHRGRKKGRRIREDGGPPAGADERNQLTGLMGEAFVYEQLRVSLPETAGLRWVSRNAKQYGVDGEADNDAGYDLRAVDVEGKISGIKGADCLIEVKSSTGDACGPFPMSWNEWSVADECHEEEGRCYVIFRVAFADSDPALVDVIVDPVGLEREQVLRVSSKDLWVRVGGREQ